MARKIRYCRYKWSTFFICLFLGVFGVHRFYVGKAVTGFIYLFTFGFFFIGWLIDLVKILTNSFEDKNGFALLKNGELDINRY